MPAKRKTSNESQPPPDAYEELVRNLADLIGPMNDLYRQKAAALAPIVQTLLHTRSRNQNEIEHTLDHLLDCACIPEGLALYKSLCRYYFPINPHAAASYVYAFREMWDSEEPQDEEAGG